MIGEYDFENGRWKQRPLNVRWSEMVLGRRESQLKVMKYREVTVSAYKVSDGRTFYTGPASGRAGPGVLYRIRVKLKPGVVLG